MAIRAIELARQPVLAQQVCKDPDSRHELRELGHQADDVAKDLEYIMRRYGRAFDERDRCLIRSGLERLAEIAVQLGV